MLGYGRGEVQVKLQLLVAATRGDVAPLLLNCLPLPITAGAILRQPPVLPSCADFFAQWAALPIKVEQSGG